jgi:hypothetical protein
MWVKGRLDTHCGHWATSMLNSGRLAESGPATARPGQEYVAPGVPIDVSSDDSSVFERAEQSSYATGVASKGSILE